MPVERGAQLVPGVLVGVVALDEVESRAERVDDGRIGTVDVLGDRLVGVLAELVVGPVAAGHADHGHLQHARAFELVQRREQLALGEVAGGAEQHECIGVGLVGLHPARLDVAGCRGGLICHRVASFLST